MTDSSVARDDIRIVEATAAHTEELSRLVLEFRNEHSRLIGGPGAMEIAEAISEVEHNLAAEHRGYFMVISGAHDDTGDAPPALGYRLWGADDGYFFTRELYVTPAARRGGVAAALIRQFERWLLAQGQQTACISCTPHNVAMLELARAQGYTILNTIEIRKHLTDVPRPPRATTNALGFEWRIL